MTFPFSFETVKTMDQKIRDEIINLGVPIEIYDNGYVNLGANNKSAITRLSNLAHLICKNNLPTPPSPFLEYVVSQTTGTDKQDYRLQLDAKKPGDGKSYSASFILQWYAYLMGEKFGQRPKDFFNLDNCALLEDTDGILQLLDETEKQQGVLIDDAGVAIGAKEHQSVRNRNFNKVAMTCRTKRWFVVYTAPLVTNIDLQTRELTYGKSVIYKPFHDLGFNLLKKYIIDTRVIRNKKFYNERRMTFFNRKFDFWVAFRPDYFKAYRGFAEAYDLKRDTAADVLIHDTAGKERASKDPRTSREKTKQQRFDEHFPTIKDMYEKKKGIRAIARKTGLSDHMINQFIAKGGLEE